MTNYDIILQRFNTEFRNGPTFATNPTTDFTTDLKANAGELCKLTQTIEISVTVNPYEIQTIQFNATAHPTFGNFVGTGINFQEQGLYNGAVVDITWGGGAPVSVQISLVYGSFFNTIQVPKAALISAGIVDGDIRTDFKIRLTSQPDTLIYKYGLNPNDFPGTNYTSWFDSNTQAYYLFNLTTSFQAMTRVTPTVKSWDISSVQAKFDSTSGSYYHQYTVEHIFRLPYYVEGEYENLNDAVNPAKFLGTQSIRYDNGWFFGGTTIAELIKVEIKGGSGNVGYFRESYNGQANNYSIQNVSIANADNSNVLEGSVVNTLTFQIVKTGTPNFGSSSKVILYHSKLPTQTEYQNKPDLFSTIWIFESLTTTAGASAVSGTIITNFDVTVNANPLILDVTADIQYTTDQQSLIFNDSNYLLWVSVGNEGAINPDDRVALPVDLNQFSKNLDVPGLVQSIDATFFEPFEFNTGTRDIATITGFNGDVMGARAVLVREAILGVSTGVSKAVFRIITTDGDEEGELLAIEIPLIRIPGTTLGGYTYQLVNKNSVGVLNMPASLPINRLTAVAEVPAVAGDPQEYVFEIGFQIPWREWIFNNNIPNSIYDSTKPNNNQNFRTSDYSNVDGFEIFAVWDFTMYSGSVETIYRKLTAESNITDFDTNGTSGFSANILYYDEDGNDLNNLSTANDGIIVAEFNHGLGTLNAANMEGYIWIEREGTTSQPFYIHTSINTNMPNSPLKPTDSLGTGNTLYVEVLSVNGKVSLVCGSVANNLSIGVNYNVYARLKNKTAL